MTVAASPAAVAASPAAALEAPSGMPTVRDFPSDLHPARRRGCRPGGRFGGFGATGEVTALTSGTFTVASTMPDPALRRRHGDGHDPTASPTSHAGAR